MQWRLIDDEALQFRSWEDEFVVYNRLSGDTHILDKSAAEILLALQRRGTQDTLSLAQFLAPTWQCDPSQSLLDELEIALSDMQALSLVERI